MLVREKQKSEEVDRLQDVIQKLLHDAGTKTKQEVRQVYTCMTMGKKWKSVLWKLYEPLLEIQWIIIFHNNCMFSCKMSGTFMNSGKILPLNSKVWHGRHFHGIDFHAKLFQCDVLFNLYHSFLRRILQANMYISKSNCPILHGMCYLYALVLWGSNLSTFKADNKNLPNTTCTLNDLADFELAVYFAMIF